MQTCTSTARQHGAPARRASTARQHGAPAALHAGRQRERERSLLARSTC